MLGDYCHDLIRTTEAITEFVQKNACWPTREDWDTYAGQHGFYNMETLQYFGLLDGLKEKYENACKDKEIRRKNETNLRKARKVMQLSAKEVAHKVGCSYRRLIALESKPIPIKQKELERLAEVMECEIDYIKEERKIKFRENEFMAHINSKQKDILNFIEDYPNICSPSIPEISDGVGLSCASVFYHLKELKKRGYIERPTQYSIIVKKSG
jgi:transcriptional regulator with XRE-family HTH domain